MENRLEAARKNPALKAARTRAAQILHELVLPLYEDPTVSIAAMQAHSKKHIDRLMKLAKAKQIPTTLENGTGETLEACRVELHKLAGK